MRGILLEMKRRFVGARLSLGARLSSQKADLKLFAAAYAGGFLFMMLFLA